MGIDKSDVRFVVHWTVPHSFESFLQESGRAARDGRRASSLVYYADGDASLARYMLRKGVGTRALPKRLAAFERVVEHCCAAKGCRRRSLLRHFGVEGSAMASAQPSAAAPSTARISSPSKCCDACENPARVAAAAAELEAWRIKPKPGAVGSATVCGHTIDGEAEQERGARKRSRNDPHNTGLIDDDESDDDMRDDGIAKAGTSAFVCVAPAAGPQKDRQQVDSFVDSLLKRESAKQQASRKMSSLAKLKARLR